MRKSMLAVIGMLAAVTAAAQQPKPSAPPAKTETTKAEAPKGEAPKIDAILGNYRFKSGLDMSVERSGDTLTVKSTGTAPQTLSATPDGRFNYLSIPGYLTFDVDASGIAKTLHFHYDEQSLPATRIDAAAAKKASDALELKIKNQTHDPVCEATLRRLIEEARAGKPDYSKMTLTIAQATRAQLPMLQARINELGAVKEVKFFAVGPNGAEMFNVAFDNGSSQWVVFCLAPGYLSGVGFR